MRSSQPVLGVIVRPTLAIAGLGLLIVLMGALAGCAEPPWYVPSPGAVDDEWQERRVPAGTSSLAPERRSTRRPATKDEALALIHADAVEEWCSSGTLKARWYSALECGQ